MEKMMPFIESVRNIITVKDYDWIHVIVGPEGIGKTSLAWSICKSIDPDFDGFRDSVFSYKEFVERIEKSTPGKSVVIDEGALVFYSRDFMMNVNKKTIKLMTAIRAYNMFIVICVPNFWILDPYIRMHRVKTLSRVVTRGWFWHYSPRTVHSLARNKKKPMQTVWPPYDIRDNFPDASKRWPDEWNKYKKKKAALSTTPDKAKEGAVNKKCQHCGYQWEFKGKIKHPTCPSCMGKL